MILLTAFRPFGPKGWVTGTNASAVVLEGILTDRPDCYGSEILPTDAGCLPALGAALDRAAWTGVLAMGETGAIGSEHVVLEPFANVMARPSIWTFGRERMEAGFAATADALALGGGSMGGYWCNMVHLEILRWSQAHAGAPAAFVHIPAVLGEALPLYGERVRGLYARYVEEVCGLLDQMEQAGMTAR